MNGDLRRSFMHEDYWGTHLSNFKSLKKKKKKLKGGKKYPLVTHSLLFSLFCPSLSNNRLNPFLDLVIVGNAKT